MSHHTQSLHTLTDESTLMTQATQDQTELDQTEVDPDTTEEEETTPELTPVEQLKALKQRADIMGLTYSPNIGLETLRKRVADVLNDVVPVEVEEPSVVPAAGKAKPGSLAHKAAIRKELMDRELKLVRLRITNMNPSKRDLPGEIFTVANKFVGNVKKYVAYGEATENGYHVPYIIYKQLKSRKFLQVRTQRDKVTGQIVIHQSWAPEFALEVLPPLTREELDKLAAAQAAGRGTA